ncbi:MAG: LysR family transcriptional regulator [Bacteroidetes bacterium]|nr:LysR family transcriptional regulator [Bacteroidota bacterium]
MEHLDLDVLRTFVSIVDLNGFNKAAEQVHLSQSAISMQMKRLEDQTGHALFERKGRQHTLTHQGEVLLSYARKMLELNDEALLNLKESKLKGKIKIGLQLDLAQSHISNAIYRYARLHPEMTIDLKVDASDTLQELLTKRKLDLIFYLSREKNRTFDSVPLSTHPLEWIGAPSYSNQSPIPLVTLGPNCKMRQAISAALTNAGIPWRIAFTSSSLPSAWDAVSAGIGITARTRIGMPASLTVLPKSLGLPPLPAVQAYLCTSPGETSRLVNKIREFFSHFHS